MSKSNLQPSKLGGVEHTLEVDSQAAVEKLRIQAGDRPAELRVEVTAGTIDKITFTDCAEFDGVQDSLGIVDPGLGYTVHRAVFGSPVVSANARGWDSTSAVGSIYRFTIPPTAEWSLWLQGTGTVKVSGRLLDK